MYFDLHNPNLEASIVALRRKPPAMIWKIIAYDNGCKQGKPVFFFWVGESRMGSLGQRITLIIQKTRMIEKIMKNQLQKYVEGLNYEY